MPGPLNAADFTTAYCAGDGLTLRYYRWGPAAGERSRAPIILLHGVTDSALSWQTVAEALAHERPVIALDARGHGGSDWSAEEAYAPDQHFADLATALDALALEEATLVGFSMGGAVATICAAARPDRVARLVIVDAYPAPDLSPGSRRIAQAIAALYEAGGGFLTGGFDPAIARWLRDDLVADAARRLDLWPLWEALAVPTLVVRGGQSDVLTAAMAAEMIARQPRARLLTLPGVGHQIPAQRPHDLARAILSHA